MLPDASNTNAMSAFESLHATIPPQWDEFSNRDEVYFTITCNNVHKIQKCNTPKSKSIITYKTNVLILCQQMHDFSSKCSTIRSVEGKETQIVQFIGFGCRLKSVSAGWDAAA